MENIENLRTEYKFIYSSLHESYDLTKNINNFFKNVKVTYEVDFFGFRKNIEGLMSKTSNDDMSKIKQLDKLNNEYHDFLDINNNLTLKLKNEVIDPIEAYLNHMEDNSEEDLVNYSKVIMFKI